MKNNHPILELLKELRGPLGNAYVHYLVNIGTGTTKNPTYRPGIIGLVKTLKRLATDTEAKHSEVMRDPEYKELRVKYFRLDVEGLGDVDLSGWHKLPEIRSRTNEFLQEYGTRQCLRKCAALLVDGDESSE